MQGYALFATFPNFPFSRHCRQLSRFSLGVQGVQRACVLTSQEPLVFGVYPFGIVGGPRGAVVGPPDDFARIGSAMEGLAGDGPPLLVRLYVTYEGAAAPALDQVAQFAPLGSVVDLSLNYHDRAGNVERWCSFVEQVVQRHGSSLGSIGITNEANLLSVPYAPDGAYPNALEALVDGILVAAATKARVAAGTALGFTAAADVDPANDAEFWQRVTERGGHAFGAALGFAGLTLYPGGFSGPADLGTIARRTTEALTSYRARLLGAGIPDAVPIRVSECGWPTGPGRTEEEQAEALCTIVSTIADLQGALSITHCELFTLRDADSGSQDDFGHFGLLRDDYTPKPAYHALRALLRAHRLKDKGRRG